MSAALFYQLNDLFNILLTFALVIVLLIKNDKPKALLALSVFMFLTQIVNLFYSFYITPMLGFCLITLLFFLIKEKKPTKVDTSQEISQARAHERSRIYANLHDDVGAKLLELIYSAESKKTKALAKEVLSDIRQAVASTINVQCTTIQLNTEIAQEIQSRIEVANLNYSYYQDNKYKKKLTGTIPSVLSRIMREATSNIIKHAKASDVVLTIDSTEQCLTMKLEDNGIGLNANNKNGKGLKTIKKRAQSINAMVKWSLSPKKGTIFTLTYYYGNH